MGALADPKFFREGKVQEQREVEGIPFPQVLEPHSKSDVQSLNAAISANKAWLESELKRSGAILLRGFDVSTAAGS